MSGGSLKARARAHVKRHYVLLVMLCAVSIFLGAEFTSIVSNAQTWYDLLTNQETEINAEGIWEEDGALQRYVDNAIHADPAVERAEADARVRALKSETAPDAMLGRQKGALAAVMNALDSGRFYATLASAFYGIAHSRRGAAILMILCGVAVYGAVWVFLRNFYKAVLRRAFLETRAYPRMPLSHLFHFRAVRRWKRASLTLLLAAVYQSLWDLTVIGGVVKRYSYFLVPYIVAENPDVRPREAVTLSRRMMNGHKWACCKLELSLLGWVALGFLTFGVTEVLWGVPYRVAVFTEYYAGLRGEALARGVEGAARLNDACLFERADEATLRERYADIARREDIIEEDIVELTPRQRFFARNFGIWWGSLSEKIVYSRQAGLRQQTLVDRMEMRGEAYPQRMNPLWPRGKRARIGKVSYLAPVTVWTLIAAFFVFGVAGWVWEVSLHLMTHGTFVNRGALHGPWLPIYGSGVVLIAVLLYRLRTKPALEALAVAALCGCVEYATSWLMELTRGMRWWDYTGYFLNLNGRICAEGLAAFAVGGMAAVYMLLPIIDAAVTRARPRVLIPACLALMVCFAGDVAYSQKSPNAGSGITDDPVEAMLPEAGPFQRG